MMETESKRGKKEREGREGERERIERGREEERGTERGGGEESWREKNRKR